MSRFVSRAVLGNLAMVLVLVGCQQPNQRLNAPPHGTAVRSSELSPLYSHMEDSALLEDMTVSDYHFVPHRAILSTLGKARLARLAGLMEDYGGTVRFNTDLEDEKLIQSRTEAIMAYLAEVGVDTTQEVLTRDMRGGTGMDAREVILIKSYVGNAAVAAEKKQSSESDYGLGEMLGG